MDRVHGSISELEGVFKLGLKGGPSAKVWGVAARVVW